MSVEMMVNPPKSGSASYDQYIEEKESILSHLKRKAVIAQDGLNQLTNVTCNIIHGGLYAFPEVKLSNKVIQIAQDQGIQPDALKETGYMLVPGSGFGQRSGTYHFRTTILPDEKELVEIMHRLKAFNDKFHRTGI
jgi:aspartate/methionine/tyrosine aminotransferase